MQREIEKLQNTEMKLINERQIGVMIMKFTNLTAKEFGAFTDSMPYTHFTQTVGHYELKLAEGYETHLVGIKTIITRLLQLAYLLLYLL